MKNESVVHEIERFRGRESFNLLYLYDVLERDLSTSLEMTM